MIVLDIETVADEAFLWNDEAREIRKDSLIVPSNYKKDEAIAKFYQDKMESDDAKGALSPINGRVVCIAWQDLAAEDDDITCNVSSDPEKEAEILKDYFSDMEALGPVTLGGWMIEGFDIPFLTIRATLHGVKMPVWWPELGRKYNPRVYDLATRFQSTPGTQYKLDYYLHRFGIPRKTGKGSEIDTMTDEQIADYCKNDVVVEAALIRKFYAKTNY